MKTIKLILVTVFLFHMNVQLRAQKSINIQLGSNYCDINYGVTLLANILPQSDYLIYSGDGEGAFGYHFDIGASYSLTKKINVEANIDYSILRYHLSGSVSDKKASVIRPNSDLIPIKADGHISYSFIGLKTNLKYSLNDNIKKGFYLSINLEYLASINTDWNLDVVYEDGRKGNDNELTNTDEQLYKSLIFAGIGTGYHFSINENMTLTPNLSFQYAIEGLVGNAPPPTKINFDISVARWF